MCNSDLVVLLGNSDLNCLCIITERIVNGIIVYQNLLLMLVILIIQISTVNGVIHLGDIKAVESMRAVEASDCEARSINSLFSGDLCPSNPITWTDPQRYPSELYDRKCACHQCLGRGKEYRCVSKTIKRPALYCYKTESKRFKNGISYKLKVVELTAYCTCQKLPIVQST